MNLLNLGCGATRIVDDTWINLDNLRPVLAVGTPERTNLDAEPNYVNADITQTLPFTDGMFDGVLCSHVIEHFDCQQGVAIMRECHRILKPGGVLLVSVPDASIFRRHHHEDTPENAVRLFGEPIHLPDGENTFAGYALWNRFHKAILTEDVLWCYFVRAGFREGCFYSLQKNSIDAAGQHEIEALNKMLPILNRIPFSLVMMGAKL